MSDTTELPAGVGWARSGDLVIGRVLVVEDGEKRPVATLRLSLEQAAEVALQLLGVIRGSQ
ncbi:hypothetical protein GS538_11930 [Rhodococcus hoagii]|nr:hypothetical protein [Prescottella equi]MBM4577220.1 hypothetical protein [Prescottella equi]NKR28949.1 hypothetical protein [Prescottella equi]NKR30681.1 hypothetical protein [Prescottella equi]NKV09771.1 hypothetical protein [Prescottella equi]